MLTMLVDGSNVSSTLTQLIPNHCRPFCARVEFCGRSLGGKRACALVGVRFFFVVCNENRQNKERESEINYRTSLADKNWLQGAELIAIVLRWCIRPGIMCCFVGPENGRREWTQRMGASKWMHRMGASFFSGTSISVERERHVHWCRVSSILIHDLWRALSNRAAHRLQSVESDDNH